MITLKLASPLAIAAVVAGAEVLLQGRWIKWQRRRQMNLVQKAYGPRVDMDKKGNTPSMGGLVFMVGGLIFLGLAMGSGDADQASVWVYALMSGLIGLVDDLLKFFHHSSEGFTSRHKFIAQLVVTLLWLVGAWKFTQLPLQSLGVLAFPLAAFFAIGGQNAVNVTDGMDGLATGAMALSLLALGMLGGVSPSDLPCWLGLGLCIGFLWHNCHPADVFMGDCGAHFLGGLLAAQLFITKLPVLYFVPIFFIFGLEMLSTTVQIIAIRKFGTRLFLMAPMHHHFQIMGWNESKVTMRFWLIHAAGLSVGVVLLALIERW